MVELFSAIKAGDLQVKFIPKDATQATLIVENKTKKPLRIALPSAFAGVPALAQDDGGGGFDDFGGGGLGAVWSARAATARSGGATRTRRAAAADGAAWSGRASVA